MFLVFLFYLFIFISVLDVLHFGFYLVGANYYDVWQFRRRKRLAQLRPRKPRPLVTVLIPAHNEEKTIVRCLESVRKNTHRKLEIIVIDDASKDNTRQLVRKYIAEHSNRNIKLMYRQKNAGKAEALNHALKRAAKGEFIMTLDADSIIHRQAIKNAISYFKDKRVMGVAANVRILDDTSVLGLLQKFEHMIGYRSKKFYSVTNSEFIVGGVGSTYRADILRKVRFYDNDTATEDIGLSLKIVARGNRNHKIVYAVDVLALTEGVQSFKALFRQRYRWKLGSLQNLIKYRRLLGSNSTAYSRMLTLYRLPMAFLGEVILLLEPLAIGYVLYICYLIASPSFIIGAYITITIYLLWNLWPDEHMSNSKKLKMSLYAPAMYFIFYIMNVVQLAAVVRCLLNFKTIFKASKTHGSWISPERRGKQQVQFS